jgi:hypothetical protein
VPGGRRILRRAHLWRGDSRRYALLDTGAAPGDEAVLLARIIHEGETRSWDSLSNIL